VPAELQANLMQWLIRLCVIRFYVEAWYAPICPVTLPSAHALGNVTRQIELADDDTHVSKHVGATE
jgi:hypothetical protein